ncbi:ATP-dependent protease [Lentibacillus sp. JNUCC-1]|uniref:ISL3 family transposase n=1 Tax=Lentibacillus sp. JNUCC-1 TaxID=2654513 RepID=UPI0012E80102|nr:ISL3 family transposase [Lentibacillus sp. JNUCC-1]MUV38035.1 ATP-dependent protease [Lentibacillus sp. JNUCC-1]
MNNNIHLPGFEAFVITNSLQFEDCVHIHVELKIQPHRCPVCHRWTNKVHDYRKQKVKHTKMFTRHTYIFYRKRRYKCEHSDCPKKGFPEDNPLVERYQRQSVEFKQAMGLEVIHGKNFADVAARMGTSPTTVMRRFDAIGSSMLDETKELPSTIAIDEYKGDAGGEKYQTIIADPVDRRTLDILPDRKKDTLKAYLHHHGQKVNKVVMDMSQSFKAAVDQALGGPIVIADRFHFCRYIHWALERVRIKVQKEFIDYDRKKCKRMKHAFHKKPEDLTSKQRWYLDYYLSQSDYLREAYQLKEAYRHWFEEAKALGADHLKVIKDRLYEFYDLVRSSGVVEFQKAIETLQNWQKEIINSFAFDLNNGYIEGLNNQTKVIKRNAFGFQRFDRFRMRILLHHQYKRINTRVA